MTRVWSKVGAVLGAATLLAALAPSVGAAENSDPAPLAEPEFQFWFAPPIALGAVSDLAVRAGRVAVADRTNDVVHVFEESGAFVRTVTGPGGALGDFGDVFGVALGANGRLIVTDPALDRVSVFGPGGDHKFTFGSSGSAPGLFDFPAAVLIGAGGKIYVGDGGNNRIDVFDASGSHLDTIGPSVGGSKEEIGAVGGMDFTSDGHLVVRTGSLFAVVLVIDLNGNLVTQVSGSISGSDVSVDSEDRIWNHVLSVTQVRDLDDVWLGSWSLGTLTAPGFGASGNTFVVTDRIEVYRFHQCNDRLATYVGTSNADFVTGTAQDDVVVLRGGNDIYFGGPGRDLICGGPGADQLHGGSGRDRIYGQGGPDEILGDGHLDRLFGGQGRDDLRGGHGPDRLYGGNHKDELRGGGGSDQLFGGNGPDDCFGGPGTDSATSCASEVGIP